MKATDGVTNRSFLKKLGRRIARTWGPPRKGLKKTANKGVRSTKRSDYDEEV